MASLHPPFRVVIDRLALWRVVYLRPWRPPLRPQHKQHGAGGCEHDLPGSDAEESRVTGADGQGPSDHDATEQLAHPESSHDIQRKTGGRNSRLEAIPFRPHRLRAPGRTLNLVTRG